MENFKELQKFISGLGWFSGIIELKISLQNEFEGFYGKASESWEKQVIIEIISPDEKQCPNIKIVGKRYDDIDKVSLKVLQQIEKWKQSKKELNDALKTKSLYDNKQRKPEYGSNC